MQTNLRQRLMESLTSLTPPACLDPDMDDTARLDACADENEYASRVVEVGMHLALRRRMESRRAEMEEALARMDSGEYGICEDCGEDIGLARLMANPAARLCVHCQADREDAPYRRCA